MTALLAHQPSAIIVTGTNAMICFGETDPAHFRAHTDNQRGTMLARVYTPDEFEDAWRLVWFEVVSERYGHEPGAWDTWNYLQYSKRYLTAEEVEYCQQVLATA